MSEKTEKKQPLRLKDGVKTYRKVEWVALFIHEMIQDF